ncbi:hypothetical protein ADL26_17810, partial [Thermoactinomyces vulgaris]
MREDEEDEVVDPEPVVYGGLGTGGCGHVTVRGSGARSEPFSHRRGQAGDGPSAAEPDTVPGVVHELHRL